jgi:Rad3-related DNA helicase
LALAFGVDPEPAHSALRDLESRLNGLESTAPEPWKGEIARIASRLQSFRVDFENLAAGRDSETAYWVEEFSNPHKAALRSMPLDLESALGQRLRSLFPGGALLSPALFLDSTDGRYFLRSLGLGNGSGNKVPLRRIPDPNPPGFWLAPFTPAAAALDSGAAFARCLGEAAAPFADQGIFVYFPSQGALRIAHRVLKESLPSGSPVWAQHIDGGREALARLYSTGRGGWILATEGMADLRDNEGHAPALAVIARMPLPVRDPLWEARADRISAAGRNPRLDLWHPAAALRLKRELVPLRRDGGARMIWLLDARASGEGLGAFAARALGCDPASAQNLQALRAQTARILG